MKLKFYFLSLLFTVVLAPGCAILQKSMQANHRSSGSKSSFSQKDRIAQLEAALTERRQLEQYSRVLPWFENDDEKIEFLQLAGLYERQQWIREIDFFKRPAQQEDQLRELIDSRDIAVGMPEAIVRKSWGEPDAVEVSGHPLYKNYRWKYQKYASTEDGFAMSKKTVYFEGGKVAGWEVQ